VWAVTRATCTTSTASSTPSTHATAGLNVIYAGAGVGVADEPLTAITEASFDDVFAVNVRPASRNEPNPHGQPPAATKRSVPHDQRPV